MRIGLRGAPHNKSWSIGTTDIASVHRVCTLRINETGQAVCAATCCLNSAEEAARIAEDVPWCEMKAAEVLEQALCRVLVERGHEVFIAPKKYRLGYPSSKATQNTKDAMKELWTHDLDVALAIHTNSASKTSRAFQAMYPTDRNAKQDESEDLCTEICEMVVRSGYPHYTRVREYSSYEGNMAPCAHAYLEVDYGNSNPDAARDFLRHIDDYARDIADGIESWWTEKGGELPKQEDIKTRLSNVLADLKAKTAAQKGGD